MIQQTPDIDQVTSLLHEVAEEVILPGFRDLRQEDIERKLTPGDPDDIVTLVDRQAEEWLTQSLLSLVPSAAVIGEEAVHRQPKLLRLLDGDEPLWLLDPIDGTKNFASGMDSFGIMLAWVTSGCVRAAWIFLPAQHQTFVAERGSGVFWNGVRVKTASSLPGDSLRGTLHLRYMPDTLGEHVSRSCHGRFLAEPNAGSAAIEYTEILRGKRDFSVYYRLLPWDHAPGALILTEGGGRVEHLDGKTYCARSENQVTIVAQNGLVSSRVRSWLRPKTAEGSLRQGIGPIINGEV